MSNPNPTQSAQNQADAWNRYYPIGTPVIADVKGKTAHSVTTSTAIVLQDRPVVWIADCPFAVPIWNIRPDHERIDAKGKNSMLKASSFTVVVPPNREIVLMLEGHAGEVVINTMGYHPTVTVQPHPGEPAEQFTFEVPLEVPCESISLS
jgi:hypothetical protein